MKIIFSSVFSSWFASLRDPIAYKAVLRRLARLQIGEFGDMKYLRGVRFQIMELRIHCLAGYRIYARRKGDEIIIMLCAGNKDTQQKDIEKAEKLCRECGDD